MALSASVRKFLTCSALLRICSLAKCEGLSPFPVAAKLSDGVKLTGKSFYCYGPPLQVTFYSRFDCATMDLTFASFLFFPFLQQSPLSLDPNSFNSSLCVTFHFHSQAAPPSTLYLLLMSPNRDNDNKVISLYKSNLEGLSVVVHSISIAGVSVLVVFPTSEERASVIITEAKTLL